MVVEHRGEQVVSSSYCMEVAREVKIDSVRWQDLTHPSASTSSLSPEARPKRRLAECYADGLAQSRETLCQADARCRLALSGSGRCNRRDQHDSRWRLSLAGSARGQPVSPSRYHDRKQRDPLG